MATTSSPNIPFSVNPTPQPGSGTFGQVPGATGLPNPFGDISSVFPALGQANNVLGTNLLSNAEGVLSPGTMNALQLANAQFGNQSGMGPSGLSTNALFGNIANFSNMLQQQAAQNYGSLVPTVAGTQTVSPAQQIGLSQNNAALGAAPNPAQYMQYLASLFRQGAGGSPRFPGGVSFAPGGGGTSTGNTNPFATLDTFPSMVGSSTATGTTNSAAGPSFAQWLASTFGPAGPQGATGAMAPSPGDEDFWSALGLGVPSGGTGGFAGAGLGAGGGAPDTGLGALAGGGLGAADLGDLGG